MTIRVGIVDDQSLVRTGFGMTISSQDDMEVVMEAENGKAAVERSEIVDVDVLLMDIRMPLMDGLEATRIISARPNAPKILILTTFEEEDYILGAVYAGASGFLVKDAPPEQLFEAIRAIYRGEAMIGTSSTKKLVAHLAATAENTPTTDPTILDGLTDRELAVLKLVAQGANNAEISTALHVAEATVKTHIGHIFSKLGARDRVRAVLLAYEAGLVRSGEVS